MPDAQAGGHAVAETLEQVVVHALGDPGGQRRVGDPVADVGVGGPEHGGQVGRQLGERPVGGDLVALGHDTVPERRLHGGHPAIAAQRRSCGPWLGGAVPDRARPGPHRSRRRGRGVAPAAARRLADHRRPVLRRPGAVAARPGGQRLLGGGPDAPDDRPTAYVDDLVGAFVAEGPPAADRLGPRAPAGGPRGRPRVARRHPGAGGGDPGAAGGPDPRGSSPATPTCSACARRAGWSWPTCRPPPT